MITARLGLQAVHAVIAGANDLFRETFFVVASENALRPFPVSKLVALTADQCSRAVNITSLPERDLKVIWLSIIVMQTM